MSSPVPERAPTGPRPTEAGMIPEPYPWCLACGFQHSPAQHCADCTGDHSAGFCMTPEAAAELARLDTPGFRRRVERDAARLHADAIRFLSGRRIPPLCAWLRSAGGVIRSCSFDVVSGVDGQS